ncbi:hypothetical protein LguiA_020128 [Lonicera macranthoides]
MAEPIFTSLYSSITSYFTPTFLFCFLNLMIGTIFIASNFKYHKEEEDHHHNEHQQQLARVPSLLERVKSIDFSLYRSEQPDPTQLEPVPSLLQRVKSFSLYKEQRPDLHSDHTHYHPDPVYTQQMQVQEQVQVLGYGSGTDTQYPAPSLLERVKSFSLSNSEQPDPDPDTQNSSKNRPVRYPTLLQRVKSIKLSLYPSDRPDPDSEIDPLSHPDHHVARSKSDKAPAKMRKSASEKNVGPTEEGEDEVDRRRPETARERKRSETTSFGGEDEGVDAKADDFINKFKQQLKLQRLDSLIRYREMLNRR